MGYWINMIMKLTRAYCKKKKSLQIHNTLIYWHHMMNFWNHPSINFIWRFYRTANSSGLIWFFGHYHHIVTLSKGLKRRRVIKIKGLGFMAPLLFASSVLCNVCITATDAEVQLAVFFALTSEKNWDTWNPPLRPTLCSSTEQQKSYL